jgi:hypothetical protein
MNIEERLKAYDLGNSILQKFAGKNTAQIKAILFKILPEKYKGEDIHCLITSGDCVKIFKNDVLNEIEICFYDKIEISFIGISFIPEHRNIEKLIPFDNNFNVAQLD